MQTQLLSYTKLHTQLADTQQLLEQADFDDQVCSKKVTEQISLTLKQCIASAVENEQYLFPLAAPYEPSVVDTLLQHQRNLCTEQLFTLLDGFADTSNHHEQNGIAKELREKFSAFVLAQTNYLVRLRKALLPIMQRYYSQACLVAEANQIMEPEKTITKKSSMLASPTTELSFHEQIYLAEMELAKTSNKQKPQFALNVDL